MEVLRRNNIQLSGRATGQAMVFAHGCDQTGHCPNLSAPEETIAAIQAFL
jgi:hypothetical protein